jgi:hypothetical protein
MRLKRLLICFGLALFTHIFLSVGGLILWHALVGNSRFADFLVDKVYWPFIALCIGLSGARGESTMIMPPLIGVCLGVFLYSAVLTVAYVVLIPKRWTW